MPRPGDRLPVLWRRDLPRAHHYRKAPGRDRALAVLRSGAGLQYDADVIAAFERVLANGFEFPSD